MKQYIAILLSLFCLTTTAFSQNVEVKVYKVHPNYDGLFDEQSIMIPAQAKIMMKLLHAMYEHLEKLAMLSGHLWQITIIVKLQSCGISS